MRPIVLDSPVSILDESGTADAAVLAQRQRGIVLELRDWGISALPLIRRFLRSPTRLALLQERRIAQAMNDWGASRADAVDLEKTLAPLSRHQLDAAVQAVELRLGELHRPALYAAGLGALPGVLSPAQRSEALRRRKKRLRPLKIRVGADVASIQQRYMPRLRVAVYRYVRTHADADRQMSPHEAYRLTVAFIQAFFPKWGRTTTLESVRKAIAATRKVRQSASG